MADEEERIMDRNMALEAARVTEAAALSASRWMGLGDEKSADAAFSVDGLAGASLTSRGVSQLLRFWLDEQGFGTFLENLRQQGA